jgi:cytochrome c oxidase assembly protein subunit 15
LFEALPRGGAAAGTQSVRPYHHGVSTLHNLLRPVALASVIANVGIVITGGAVRLTGSGLGCPTWPRCTAESYVATPEMGIYGAIEFGNRMLTFAVGLVAVAGFVLALIDRPRRRRLVRLSVLVALGIPAQAIVGGITVLTDLNPWVVGCHFLASMGVIAAAYAFWRATGESDAPPQPVVPSSLRALTWTVTAVTAAVLVVGTVVTGSGPHAGDADAKRNGLDPATISQAHADLVFLLIGLAVAAWFAFRAVGGRQATVRAAWLIAIIFAQGLIGFVQYVTQLPAILVGAHMAGACAVWLAVLATQYATQTRPHDVNAFALGDHELAAPQPR